MIIIVDYGVGNVHSILNMLKKIGVEARLSKSPQDIYEADQVILPGVGSFDYGMTQIKSTGYDEAIIHFAKVLKKPLLGICLGMQMLGCDSEEGALPGLGLIPFRNVKFKFEQSSLKIPHMGWNIVETKKPESLLCRNFMDDFRFYFVHSYYAVCDNSENILLSCDYGKEFAAGVINDNIIGVQFHPEKSHRFGMQLLKNFSEMK